jgi:hypothetical protein
MYMTLTHVASEKRIAKAYIHGWWIRRASVVNTMRPIIAWPEGRLKPGGEGFVC